MSSDAARGPKGKDAWSDPRIVAPSVEAWAAMSPAERDRVEERIMDAFDDYREAMSEGTRHSRPKINAYKDLSDHFARAGRRVFLATELAVLYPGAPAIVPDLLAVMDVEDPDRERNSWRVQEEGCGVDVVLEFRNLGKKHKELVENVKEYAGHGIPEYFSFDCRAKRLRGWRLASPAARTYTQLVPQGGVFPSALLGLELGVVEGRLRFFKDLALIPSSDELVGRLQKMTDSYQDQLEESERGRTEALHSLTGALDHLAIARRDLAALLLRQLDQRGMPLTEAQRARIVECEELDRLVRWLGRLPAAATADEVLADEA